MLNKTILGILFLGILVVGCTSNPPASTPTPTVIATPVASPGAEPTIPSFPEDTGLEVTPPEDNITPDEPADDATPTPSVEAEAPSPQEFKITAKKFSFEPATVTVKKGVPVRLLITSTDVEHGFNLVAFNINKKLPVNEEVAIEFTPDKTGDFPFFCSVACGSGHGDMNGKLVVTE